MNELKIENNILNEKNYCIIENNNIITIINEVTKNTNLLLSLLDTQNKNILTKYKFSYDVYSENKLNLKKLINNTQDCITDLHKFLNSECHGYNIDYFTLNNFIDNIHSIIDEYIKYKKYYGILITKLITILIFELNNLNIQLNMYI